MPWKCKRAISFQELKTVCGYESGVLLQIQSRIELKTVCGYESLTAGYCVGPENKRCKAINCKVWQSLKRIPTRKKVKDVKAM